MERLMEINGIINEFVWGPPMLFLLVGTGVYLTLRTKFFSITKLGYILKNTFLKMFKKTSAGEGEVTAFQAVATALAATVGTGNIAGVATAISIGGPGAVFWMWVSAVFGLTTKFAEVVLSIEFREKNKAGQWVGGPMYYIENGMKKKWLASIFALFGALAAFGIGNMVQSNSVAAALEFSFGVPKLVTGLVLAGISAVVILGGIKRIGQVTERLVPFMAAFYIIGALFIIIVNIDQLGNALSLIFGSAFTGTAAVGGFAGSTLSMAMRRGVSRGVFSNEAGLGSAPIAHAAASTDHPVRQGLWGVFEVFVDTLVICTLTALSIIMSGVWNKGSTGAALTTEAFNTAMPGFGGYIVSIGILLFAYSTILGWAYYGEKCIEFIAGTKAILPYRIVYVPLVVVGAVGGLAVLWDLADTLNGLMAIPNLIALLALSPIVLKRTKEFFATKYLTDVDDEEMTA